MTMLRALGPGLLLWAVATVWGPPRPVAADGGAPAATILLVRHAEKAGDSGDVPLSAAGRQRADRLAAMLKDAGVQQIFTSEMVRTRETAAPLARQNGVTPAAVASVDALVARLRERPPGSVSLVVHHSNTIPQIVANLGGPRLPPIAEEEYDRLLVLTRPLDGKVRVLTLRY